MKVSQIWAVIALSNYILAAGHIAAGSLAGTFVGIGVGFACVIAMAVVAANERHAERINENE